jgi:hypothetical protein
MKLRGKLIDEDKKMTFPPFEMMAAALTKEGNIWAGYRKSRTGWFPKELWAKHGPSHKAKVAYFAGCTASHVETDIAIAAVRLLDAAGVDFTYAGENENCCGTPMLVCGKWDVFAETMKKNIEAIKKVGADTGNFWQSHECGLACPSITHPSTDRQSKQRRIVFGSTTSLTYGDDLFNYPHAIGLNAPHNGLGILDRQCLLPNIICASLAAQNEPAAESCPIIHGKGITTRVVGNHWASRDWLILRSLLSLKMQLILHGVFLSKTKNRSGLLRLVKNMGKIWYRVLCSNH